MKFFRHFLFQPPDDYIPAYRIGPFSTTDISRNALFLEEKGFENFFALKHYDRKTVLTRTGKEAIELAILQLGLQQKDCVTILTTSGNRYISKCVTKTIERYCSWSMKMESNTKVIFVNHEFGFPYENLENLREYKLPIIEDCCHAFNSDNTKGTVGKIGDFSIYSFPKFFPIQLGGLLVHKKDYDIRHRLEKDLEAYIRRVVSHYLPYVDQFSQMRRNNWNYLADLFSCMNLKPRFELAELHTPGVFMFTTPSGTDLNKLREFVNSNGIQSSAFFGDHAYFLPIHHRLEKTDMDYFALVVKTFFSNPKHFSSSIYSC